MAVVKGVKEQVHLPLYDCIEVKPGRQLGETLTSNLLRFFVDVTGKTKLLTNMQAASLLPHWNTFEARALRVVISDLCPQLPDFANEQTAIDIATVPVRDPIDTAGNEINGPFTVTLQGVKLANVAEFARRVDHSTGIAALENEEITTLGITINPALGNGTILLTRSKLKAAALQFKQSGNGKVPAFSQLFPNNGCGNVIGNFIYNTVTTFFVGEKIMIQVPTWFFPAGAGPYSENGGTITHGYPNPQATFRFAEPVVIETQQNFRVEIEIPESDVLKDLQSLYGPLFIWVVLDGYMTRDVQ
ncbi:MAG TPA: hypothetical protein VGJ66_15245 [Pyrinomonadaceae bacterium]|jgi:hypothetical protein